LLSWQLTGLRLHQQLLGLLLPRQLTGLQLHQQLLDLCDDDNGYRMSIQLDTDARPGPSSRSGLLVPSSNPFALRQDSGLFALLQDSSPFAISGRETTKARWQAKQPNQGSQPNSHANTHICNSMWI